jgi:hypothetical protein
MVDASLLELSEEYGVALDDLMLDEMSGVEVEIEPEEVVPAEPEVVALEEAEPEPVAFAAEPEWVEEAPSEMAVEAGVPEMEAPAPFLQETAELVEIDWEDETEDLASLDGLDDLEVVAAVADAAEEPAVDLSAEETISAVMASFATDDLADDAVEGEAETAEESAEDDLAEGPVTASQLWRAVLAEGPVNSVQDLLAAMTNFVEQLDAAGVRLGEEDDRSESAPSGGDFRALRAQRRQARLARQRRA